MSARSNLFKVLFKCLIIFTILILSIIERHIIPDCFKINLLFKTYRGKIENKIKEDRIMIFLEMKFEGGTLVKYKGMNR